jgi:hypothetical protein
MSDPKALSYENTSKKKASKTAHKRWKQADISVSYITEMPAGALEQALTGIYARKIRNGTLNGYAP